MLMQKYSISCDMHVMAKIDKAALANNMSRSAVARRLLELIDYVPVEKLKKSPLIPELGGVTKSRRKMI